ncbi:MAG: glycosyltransferase [Muricomes sp.]
MTVFAPGYIQEPYAEQEEQQEIQIGQEWEMYRERIIRYKTSVRKMENGMVYPKMIIPEILEVFEAEEFDCIHVHHPMFVGPAALYLGRKYDLPAIYTYHTKYEDYLHYITPLKTIENAGSAGKEMFRAVKEKIVPGYMRWFTNQCGLILAPTASMKKMISKGGTKTQTAVFPTGLEDSFYIQNEKEAKQIRKLYLQGRKHLFCTVSRLEEEKNPRFMLKGIARLKERMGANFRVLFMGEGSMRNELEEMAEELGIAGEVIFVGNVKNERVKEYLRASELFLFASKSETQGIVLAEAFAAGNPVVAVRATGVEDIVVNGKNGYMTEEDTEEWTGKIIEVLREENYGGMKIQAE